MGREAPESIADHMRRILRSIGEDPDRDGLRRTPERFEKAFRFLTSGYQQDPEKLLNGAMFTVCYDQMVLVKDIEVLQPVRAPPAAVFREMPRGVYSRQESSGPVENSAAGQHVCAAAADSGTADQPDRQRHPAKIAPLGVGVVIEGRHLCMVMRGVEKQNSQTVTSAMLGAFKNNPKTREEFLSLIRGK